MSLLNLWLIRHGESTANTGVWSKNVKDVELTALGRQQAIASAENVLIQPDLLVVSPFKRAIDTAIPIAKKWPLAPIETWMIQEFTYLSAIKYEAATSARRATMIKDYWHVANPVYCDGEDSESFNDFMQRVQHFHQRILLHQGFVVAVGHGQFFKAFLLQLQKPYDYSSKWMSWYRQQELGKPIKNGEIIQLERLEKEISPK